MAKSIKHLFPKLDVFKFLMEEDYLVIEPYTFIFKYKKGAFVFKEGTYGGYMFFIVEGEAEVSKQIDNNRVVITTLDRGRSLGEMSMLDDAKRSATVKALTDLTLIVLKRRELFKLMEDHPRTANRIIVGIASLLSRSLRDTTHEFTEKTLSLC